MTTPAFDVIEQLTRVTPFGLGLWDVATGKLVSDSMKVRVSGFVNGTAHRSIDAQPNRAGVFIAQEFPTLRSFEFGMDGWEPASPAQVFLVEVRDGAQRYTPFAMFVTLPQRGFAVPSCVTFARVPELGVTAIASPPKPPQYVPLFSTASRSVPAGLAVVRASLVDVDLETPAEYAVLEVSESGKLLGRGVSDSLGEVAVLFGYPEPESPQSTSPPTSPPTNGGALSLTEQEWTVDIAVRYTRNLPLYASDARSPVLPDLCELLDQPLATVTTGGSPPGSFSLARLRYGEELVLGRDEGAKELFISPV